METNQNPPELTYRQVKGEIPVGVVAAVGTLITLGSVGLGYLGLLAHFNPEKLQQLAQAAEQLIKSH